MTVRKQPGTGHLEIVFGLTERKPTRGFPPGKLRLRVRTGEFVKARVKTADGISEFYVKEQDGFWIPAFEIGANVRKP